MNGGSPGWLYNNKNMALSKSSSTGIMPFPSVREQVELCRHIASQLVANDNARSKGANMFFKRVKKAHTWEVPPLDDPRKGGIFEGLEEEDEEKMRQKLAETILNTNEKSATRNLSLVLNPRGQIHSLSSLKAEGIMVNEHDAVSPIIMSRLIKDLESPEANPRAFELFSKRKQMSQEWELVSNGTRDPKVSSLGPVEEPRKVPILVEEEKENKKQENFPPPIQEPVVNLRRQPKTFDVGGSNKRFSLLDPDYFVPAAGSSLSTKFVTGSTSAVRNAPLPWGAKSLNSRASHSQTPEPVSHKILSSSSAASPAFSMIESSSTNSTMNNYLHNNYNAAPVPGGTTLVTPQPPMVPSSLASTSLGSKLSSMCASTSTLNNSNYGLNTAINNFNRNYYFNSNLPTAAKSYGGSATNLRSGTGGYYGNGTADAESVKLRRHDNYNRFCNSNNRNSACYSNYNYNSIMGMKDNQNPRQQIVTMTRRNPYDNLPESILL